jgi:hypothetical protein
MWKAWGRILIQICIWSKSSPKVRSRSTTFTGIKLIKCGHSRPAAVYQYLVSSGRNSCTRTGSVSCENHSLDSASLSVWRRRYPEPSVCRTGRCSGGPDCDNYSGRTANRIPGPAAHRPPSWQWKKLIPCCGQNDTISGHSDPEIPQLLSVFRIRMLPVVSHYDPDP